VFEDSINNNSSIERQTIIPVNLLRGEVARTIFRPGVVNVPDSVFTSFE